MMRVVFILTNCNTQTKRNEMINNNPNNIFRAMVSEENSIFFMACGKNRFWIKVTGAKKINLVTWY